ncbi:MAG: PEP-CTERM sorting domain-containing protein [Candidatus Brocadiia bacterium]
MRAYLSAAMVLALTVPAGAAPLTVERVPEADALVRSLDPGRNYGHAGGLSVSGSAALNRRGEQMGLLDTFLRFDAGPLVGAFDAAFGEGGWLLQGAVLRLTEQGSPNNPIFNRGVGRFEVRWIAEDAWAEGTGNPRGPTTDGVAWDDKPWLLDAFSDVTLGEYTNRGEDGELALELGLPEELRADVLAGGDVSLLFTAVDDTVGFTFNSKDIAPPRLPPRLEVTADVIPEPATAALLGLGLAAVARRRRR